METIKVNTSQHVEIDYPVAGLGERIVAGLIDMGIFMGFYFLFIIILALSSYVLPSEGSIVLLCIFGAFFVFYSLLCEIFMNGQSIGKKALKIKVISLDGAQPRMEQYLIRWLFRLIDVWTTGVIGLISIAVSDKKQRIGDIVAGTTLIKTEINTPISHIAFHTTEEYTPVFTNVDTLTDRDVELIHEVIRTYQQTKNPELIYVTAKKVLDLLDIKLPEGMNELVFLQTIIKDYNYITSLV